MGDLISRQEAIDALNTGFWGVEWDKALATAILKDLPPAQPVATDTNVGDLISRQAVIDELYDWSNHTITDAETWHLKQVIGDIKSMPSAQPERKKGKWNFIGDQMFECTECGTCYTQGQFHQMRVRITDSEFPKFCPNCGADMRGEQDE